MTRLHCPECRKTVVARGCACAECGLNLNPGRRNRVSTLLWSFALMLTVQGSIVLLAWLR